MVDILRASLRRHSVLASTQLRFVSKCSWTNLSYANVATTSPAAHKVSTEWANSLARGGAAEFDGLEEQNGMMPLRKAASRLLSCHPSDIFCGSSATEMMSSVAWAVMPPKHTNVVSTKAAFPSTVYPWSRVAMATGAEIRLAPYNHDNYYTQPQDILNLIDHNTSVVVLSHVEYITGQKYNIPQFADAAHSVGALLMIDATQSMGMIPLNAKQSKADVIVASGYKWLRGTFGAAVGFLSSNAKTLIPGLVGFRSHYDMWDMKPHRMILPKNDARRFEFSTLHFGAIHGLAASINEMQDIGMDTIWKHDLALADTVIDNASRMGLELISPTHEHDQRSAIVTIRPLSANNNNNKNNNNGITANEIVEILKKEYGILVSERSGMIRISPHIDNEPHQIELLFSALDTILSQASSTTHP